MKVRFLFVWIAASMGLLSIGMSDQAEAQTQTQAGDASHRSSRIVIGYPPGQSVDTVGRYLASALSRKLDRNFFVENVPGQSGSIALGNVARSAGDLNTLTFSASSALVINPILFKAVRYNTLKNFEPVATLYDTPLLLLVNSRLPIDSVESLVSYANSHPGEISFSSPGVGSVSHLAMTEFIRRTKLKFVHVPYQGAAPSLTALAAGQVQVTFEGVAAATPLLQGGRIKALAISSAKRLPKLESIPTVAESGLPGFDVVPWVGLLTPSGVAPDKVAEIWNAMQAILQTDEYTALIEQVGGRQAVRSPPEFRKFLQAEVPRWQEFIKVSGVTAE